MKEDKLERLTIDIVDSLGDQVIRQKQKLIPNIIQLSVCLWQNFPKCHDHPFIQSLHNTLPKLYDRWVSKMLSDAELTYCHVTPQSGLWNVTPQKQANSPNNGDIQTPLFKLKNIQKLSTVE
ncbi:hypothetical protein NPIL_542131, partial [Nephila pilipes]